MSTHNIPSCERKSKIYPYDASETGDMINTHYLELPLIRTYFYVSKGVRAIEVLLYIIMDSSQNARTAKY